MNSAAATVTTIVTSTTLGATEKAQISQKSSEVIQNVATSTTVSAADKVALVTASKNAVENIVKSDSTTISSQNKAALVDATANAITAVAQDANVSSAAKKTIVEFVETQVTTAIADVGTNTSVTGAAKGDALQSAVTNIAKESNSITSAAKDLTPEQVVAQATQKATEIKTATQAIINTYAQP